MTTSVTTDTSSLLSTTITLFSLLLGLGVLTLAALATVLLAGLRTHLADDRVIRSLRQRQLTSRALLELHLADLQVFRAEGYDLPVYQRQAKHQYIERQITNRQTCTSHV